MKLEFTVDAYFNKRQYFEAEAAAAALRNRTVASVTYPEGDILFTFTDGSTLLLEGVGYEVDGIRGVLTEAGS